MPRGVEVGSARVGDVAAAALTDVMGAAQGVSDDVAALFGWAEDEPAGVGNPSQLGPESSLAPQISCGFVGGCGGAPTLAGLVEVFLGAAVDP